VQQITGSLPGSDKVLLVAKKWHMDWLSGFLPVQRILILRFDLASGSNPLHPGIPIHVYLK
jgi:hypothetical protein